MLKQIIKYGRDKKASDIHLCANCFPMLRMNGKLSYLHECNNDLLEFDRQHVADKQTVYGLKLGEKGLQECIKQCTSEKQINELHAKGETDFALDIPSLGRSRINIYKSCGNYAMAIRLLSTEIPSCAQLGIPAIVENLVKHKYGLILTVGPTGSGKSTTLAALIQKLNMEERLHIITLEDPVEYIYPQNLSMINQREIGSDTISFASGLRSALREDPDVILVGELRDTEALAVALRAAETGHLVLGTLHTRDAVSTINRIIDMLPEQREQVRAQLADCLLGIVAQELHVRKDGNGRVAAMEILLNNNAVANLIREGKTHQISSYLETGANQGMQTMAKAISKLKRDGIIKS